MSMRFVMTLAAGLALSAPAFAADPVPPKKVDMAEGVLDILFNQGLVLADENLNDIPLFEILQKISKRHNLTIVLNEETFKLAGINDIRERKANLAATQLRGIASVHQLLTLILDNTGATYLIKGGVIEIVTPAHAAKVTKSVVKVKMNEEEVPAEPLVSAIIKEKPLNEVVAMLAERYDLNIVISPQSADAKTGFVTARLLNVPADKAIELLALQNDLRVIRKGNAFLITSRDHANDMFNEKLERQRQLIELEKFRDSPPPKPEPKVEPKAEPKQ